MPFPLKIAVMMFLPCALEEPLSSWATCSKSPYSFIPTKLGGSCSKDIQRSQVEVEMFSKKWADFSNISCAIWWKSLLGKPLGGFLYKVHRHRLSQMCQMQERECSWSVQEFDAYLPHPALLDSCRWIVHCREDGDVVNHREVNGPSGYSWNTDEYCNFVDVAKHAETMANILTTDIAILNMKYPGIGVGHYSLVRQFCGDSRSVRCSSMLGEHILCASCQFEMISIL